MNEVKTLFEFHVGIHEIQTDKYERRQHLGHSKRIANRSNPIKPKGNIRRMKIKLKGP
jgi:hypothetical protein